MRHVKILLAFVIICLLVSAVPATAQDITPPPGEPGNEVPGIAPIHGFNQESFPTPEFVVEEGAVFDTYEKNASTVGLKLIEEQARPALTLVVDDSWVADADPLHPEIQGPTHSMPAEEKEGGRTGDGEIAPLTVGGRTDVFPIADSSSTEYTSVVAHGGSWYMVVFIYNGDVYAQVYSNYGAYQSTWLIANQPNKCSYPAIAYDASSGLFLVAFQYDSLDDGSDIDVLYTAVSPTTGRVGELEADNTSSSHHEWNPSVACNAVDGSCMLAYSYNVGEAIWGIYLKMNNTGVYAISETAYILSTSSNASGPYLAWGRGTGTYMLAFTHTDGILDWHPMYAHIFDVDSGGPAYVHTSRFVVPSTYFPSGHDSYATGVAFDPCTQKFVILFGYDYSGDFTDVDVWLAVKHQTGPYSFGEMSVASSDEKELEADISFVTDDYRPAACGTMDKLVVTYQSWPDGIRAVDVIGNNSTTNPIYIRDLFDSHLWVITCGTDVFCFGSSVAGGWIRGDLFTTFSVHFAQNSDSEFYGRMLEVADRTYLPLTAK